MITENNKLMTVEEFAKQIKVHSETVRRWIKDGKLKAIKLGDSPTSHWRISEEEATAFLNRLVFSLTARDGNQTKNDQKKQESKHERK